MADIQGAIVDCYDATNNVLNVLQVSGPTGTARIGDVNGDIARVYDPVTRTIKVVWI